jgi:hypothetical protein
MAQGKFEALACRSIASAGSATLTTDPSIKARLEPRMAAASVARGCAVDDAMVDGFGASAMPDGRLRFRIRLHEIAAHALLQIPRMACCRVRMSKDTPPGDGHSGDGHIPDQFSRRAFLQSAATVAGAAVLPAGLYAQPPLGRLRGYCGACCVAFLRGSCHGHPAIGFAPV